MNSRYTFAQKVFFGFATVAVLAIVVALVAAFALRDVVRSKDRVIDHAAQQLVDAERLFAMSFRKGNEARAFLMTKDPQKLETVRSAHTEFRQILERLRGRDREDPAALRLLDAVDRAEDTHERALQPVFAAAATDTVEESGRRVEREIRPLRIELDRTISAFIDEQRKALEVARQESSDTAARAIWLVAVLATAGVAVAIVASLLLSRALTRQISTAVRHVQSSSVELQATAGQQATGAKQQATAMAEITTTISELLATSRQISESAKRVAAIAGETAGAARSGDQTVQKSQESVASIRRQVDLIVSHMLELGRKSQQIGGILEIINELSEQTNILAINATIEAAGAGESGRRFAVVAEEIRKLADRVGGSTKDIRALIDEVRAAVNTTVMATESGSKAVESGARQFSDVAAAFGQIARLVGTTTDAAREIELSTKQQSTAVEQVNVAISNAAQAAREAEASSGQALQTASQLASMSRELAALVQSRDAA
jgi:methyl-accepting chemotaxis protein